MRMRPDWGPGRIDPFNPVKFRMLGLAVDATIGNSDMVPVWNMRRREGWAYHWDGLNTSIREVVFRQRSATAPRAPGWTVTSQRWDRPVAGVAVEPPAHRRPT